MTTRPEKRQGTALRRRFAPNISVVPGFVLRAFDDLGYGKVSALLFPDQIKPIGQLVPVS
jgi:hypothetical protein